MSVLDQFSKLEQLISKFEHQCDEHYGHNNQNVQLLIDGLETNVQSLNKQFTDEPLPSKHNLSKVMEADNEDYDASQMPADGDNDNDNEYGQDGEQQDDDEQQEQIIDQQDNYQELNSQQGEAQDKSEIQQQQNLSQGQEQPDDN